MPRVSARKDHPLSIRLPDADIAVIDRAARLHGRSRTDFMRDASVRAAEDAIMENALIRMSASGFSHFVAALDKPAKPVTALADVLKRKAPWEKKPSKAKI
jgi:uncharacterized protein (DUF1778 family)